MPHEKEDVANTTANKCLTVVYEANMHIAQLLQQGHRLHGIAVLVLTVTDEAPDEGRVSTFVAGCEACTQGAFPEQLATAFAEHAAASADAPHQPKH